ncbi:MAG: hydroxymethylbilane synthase [Legionella sp.]
MSSKIIRIATRNSPLALWQANYIAKQLQYYWPELTINLLPMTTSGDKFIKDKLISIGGKGLFVKELEEALLNNQADLAVHSMKDVPAEQPKGLKITTICKRENPFDALISDNYQSLQTLPPRAIIGTSSLRRQAQLLALRPDFVIKPLRGNINTRLKKMYTGEYDAIILAASGIERLSMQPIINEVLSPELMLPAPGQGALGIECRENDDTIQKLLIPLNDLESALCVHTERRVNAQLGGNCHTPVAIFCKKNSSGLLHLQAKIISVDGRTIINNSQLGEEQCANLLADSCVKSLLSQGAKEIINGENDELF